MKKALRRQLQYGLIFVLLLLIQVMPRGWGLGATSLLAQLAWGLLPKERAKTLFNLRLIFPDRDDHQRLGLEVFRKIGLNAVDAIKLARYPKAQIDRLVSVEGLERFDRAYSRGKGIVVVTGHIGCWELMAAWFAMHGYRISVIGRRVYDARLDRLLNRSRAALGITVIDRDTGAKEALRALHQGQALGVLIDQDTRVSSVEAVFFGHRAKTPTGAAALAQRTGATVLPLAIQRTADGRHRLMIGREIEPSAAGDRAQRTVQDVQRQTSAIEAFIKQDVTQWAWMHLRWMEKP